MMLISIRLLNRTKIVIINYNLLKFADILCFICYEKILVFICCFVDASLFGVVWSIWSRVVGGNSSYVVVEPKIGADKKRGMDLFRCKLRSFRSMERIGNVVGVECSSNRGNTICFVHRNALFNTVVNISPRI